ncbi:RNA polymerase sigma factor [Dictyobacter kobayashii]|uniref:RNA polymerase sigma factor n=1 Tax=Dictyobacter kobayashii TaxID=2014872 RepID=UPI000F835853|nr:sigma-70 family RNA polymerase sigma factor [Dictyobacter kobayashii]
MGASRKKYSTDIQQRRLHIIKMFNELPPYGSLEFWRHVEQMELPREVLVKTLRFARRMQDELGSGRISEVIMARTLDKNEFWANSVAQKCYELGWDEQRNMSFDLCSDLNEAILKAIFDPMRSFWEENFVHCVRYERMHVYRSFMLREGRISTAQIEKGRRIPRRLILSLDHMAPCSDHLYNPFEIEDEQAYMMLRSVDSSIVMDVVRRLPERLRSVVLLIYWADKTEKDAAKTLGISDRTVRNRLNDAIHKLSECLIHESDYVSDTRPSTMQVLASILSCLISMLSDLSLISEYK